MQEISGKEPGMTDKLPRPTFRVWEETFLQKSRRRKGINTGATTSQPDSSITLYLNDPTLVHHSPTKTDKVPKSWPSIGP